MLAQERAVPRSFDLLYHLEPALGPVAGPLDMAVHIHRRRAIRIGQEHDVRFQPLGLVQVHDAHDVGAPRLERQRLDLIRRFAVGLEGIGGVGETSSVFDHLPHAIDGVQHISRVRTAGRRRRQREIAAVFKDAFKRGGGGKDARPSVVLPQRSECGFGS